MEPPIDLLLNYVYRLSPYQYRLHLKELGLTDTEIEMVLNKRFKRNNAGVC